MEIRRRLMMMGVDCVDSWEMIRNVTLSNDAQSIVVNADDHGNVFKAKQYAFCLVAEPSSQTTQNTSAYIRVEPSTYVATLNGAVRTSKTNISGSINIIAVARDSSESSVVSINTSLSQVGFGWGGKTIPSNFKKYSDYFEIYTTGTAQFGSGTKLQLFAIRA